MIKDLFLFLLALSGPRFIKQERSRLCRAFRVLYRVMIMIWRLERFTREDQVKVFGELLLIDFGSLLFRLCNGSGLGVGIYGECN